MERYWGKGAYLSENGGQKGGGGDISQFNWKGPLGREYERLRGFKGKEAVGGSYPCFLNKRGFCKLGSYKRGDLNTGGDVREKIHRGKIGEQIWSR